MAKKEKGTKEFDEGMLLLDVAEDIIKKAVAKFEEAGKKGHSEGYGMMSGISTWLDQMSEAYDEYANGNDEDEE